MMEADLDSSIPPFPDKPLMSKKTEGSGLRRKIFDVIVGAIIPILLLIYDPVVFRNDGSCGGISNFPILGQFATFAYLAILLGVLTLVIWLLFGDSLQLYYKAFIAGILWVGALFSAVVGFSILPASIMGLIILIGALGFFPFITSFVYFRNGQRVYRSVMAATTNWKMTICLVLSGAIFVMGGPGLAQWRVVTIVQNVTNSIIQNKTAPNADNVATLVQLDNICLHLCRSNILAVFQQAVTANSSVEPVLATVYTQITGKNSINPLCSATNAE